MFGVIVIVAAFVAEGFNPAAAKVVQLLEGLALPCQLNVDPEQMGPV